MNRQILTITALLAVLTGCTQTQEEAQEMSLDTDTQKLSYAIGQQFGQGLKAQEIEVDLDIVAASMADALAGKEPRLTPEEMQAVFTQMQEALAEKKTELATTNMAAGSEFLEQNKTRDGVVTTASGLQYEVITSGSGNSPSETDRVSVHYRGTFLDGSEFDSSYKKNEPAQFAINGVIPGWTEVLQLMSVGDKWKVFIPGNLAYGERGRPGIPPNSMLIFEIELLEIL